MGFTVMEVISVDPGTSVPPHEPEYHFQCAPVPRLAGVMPFILRVILSPMQVLLNGLLDVRVMPSMDE